MNQYKLSEIFDLQMGKTPARENNEYWGGTNKWVSIADISKSGKYITETKEQITDKAIKESGIKVVPKDTVIMSFKLTIGKTAIASENMYTNEAIMAFINKGVYNIDNTYLFYLLNALKWDEGSNKAVKGITLNKAILSEKKVQIHNIEEQNQIVNILDKVSELISLRRQQIEKLDELVKARFVELFGNGNYPMVKAEDVCDFITKGTTPPTGEIYSDYSKDKVPYLKVYNLSFTGELLFDNEPQFISKDIHNGKLSRSKVYPNDVLMNIVGPPLGKFSLVTNEYEEWNINQAIAIFRAKERIEPKFLLVALMQPSVLQPFLSQAVGIRQLNLSLEQCRNLEFPLPPIDEQKQFAAFVEQTDKSKSEIQKSLEKLEELKKSLMQKYFG